MTWLTRRLLHCINLSRPHTGKVIFYCVCQPLINPRASSILVRGKKEGGGWTGSSFQSGCIYILCLYFWFLSAVNCRPPCSNTHCIVFFFFFCLLHTEGLTFSRRAPTSLERWWMTLAPVSISKLKQFRDKTSSSLSYWFSSESSFSL